jgi:hypothetical protein
MWTPVDDTDHPKTLTGGERGAPATRPHFDFQSTPRTDRLSPTRSIAKIAFKMNWMLMNRPSAVHDHGDTLPVRSRLTD